MRKIHFPSMIVKPAFYARFSALLVALLVGTAFLHSASPQALYRKAIRYFEASAKSATSPTSKQQGCCANQPPILRRMVGTYYTTEGDFKSTLILNNKGPQPIAVTPILHGQKGVTYNAPPVSVGGQSSSVVDLNAIAESAGPRFRSGSFEFTYTGRLLEMGGGIRIANSERSLIFDEQMLEPGMKFPSSQLEAVYAIPFEDSNISVIITNTTAQPMLVKGDVIFAKADGYHPIRSQLEPYETQVINLPQGLIKKASVGAASLTHNGDKGALLAMIHLQDAGRGYSETVNFTNPTGGKTAERHGAGLRLGSVNNDPLRPVIAVRNLGDSATTVSAVVPYSKQNGDMGTIALPQVSLAPGELKLLNTSNAQLRQNDFASAGLEIKYTGAPGSIIASASSVSQSGNHVFTLPVKDPKGGLSSTGGYPWFIDGTSSTVVFIKNTTSEEQQFSLSIVYPGGQWRYKSHSIAAGQTLAVDIRKLRDSQERGAEGNVIPQNATSGHISWSARGTVEKVLIGRAQTVDFSKGLSSTYECQCSCVYSWDGLTRIVPGNPQIQVGETKSLDIQATYSDCFGNPQGWISISQVGGFPPTLSSDNASVATFINNPLPKATGVGTGTTTLSASWTEQIVTSFMCDPNGSGCSCDAVFPTAYAATSVTVPCPIPTGETIAEGVWIDSVHRWRQTLLPTSIFWDGLIIREIDYSAPADTCWFDGSSIRKNEGVSGFTPIVIVAGGYPDNVGWIPEAVTYYRRERPLRALSLPCAFVTFQQMEIYCNSDWNMFARNVISGVINTTTVTSTRGTGHTISRTWP